MEEKVEQRVYVINADKVNLDLSHVVELPDAEFCEVALKEGSVYNLDDFVKIFNLGTETISSLNSYIRIF